MHRILILHGNERMGHSLREALQKTGFDVRNIHHPAEAVSAVRDFRPHALIADLEDACDATIMRTAEALRSECPRLASVFISPNPGNITRERAARAGISEILARPAGVETVQEAVRRALEELTAMTVPGPDPAQPQRRIGTCVGCGIELPLRFPNPGETGESWQCAFCGQVYHGILDPCAPADHRFNIRPLPQAPGGHA